MMDSLVTNTTDTNGSESGAQKCVRTLMRERGSVASDLLFKSLHPMLTREQRRHLCDLAKFHQRRLSHYDDKCKYAKSM